MKVKRFLAALAVAAVLTAPAGTSGDRVRSGRFLWTELIGFDNASPDLGVGAFLSRLPAKPEAVSLLLVEPSLFEKHPGLSEDFALPEKACSYGARPFNEERRRQAWTAFRLRDLVAELRRAGVRVYASFFEFGHRDITAAGDDGKPYVDTFIRTTTSFLRDFGFDGLHAADGYGHPRLCLQRRGLPVSACRKEAAKWADFWMRAATAFKKSGFDVYLNSCWTRDPYEALVRYGVDYRLLAKAPIDGFIVESSAACLSIEGWNWTPESPLDKCVAMAMRLKASVPETRLLLLHCIKDGNEQYNALRHAPPKAYAEAVAMGCLRSGSVPVFDGVMACLADGIGKDEWKRLYDVWSLAFAGDRAVPDGCRAVWCDKALDNEVDAYAERCAGSTTLLSALVSRGAPIGGMVTVEQALEDVDMPVLILNPERFPDGTLAKLLRRRGAAVLFGLGTDRFSVPPAEKEPKNWLYPLRESRPGDDSIGRAVRELSDASPVAFEEPDTRCALSSFVRPDGSRLVVIRNNADVYAVPSVVIKDMYGSVTALTSDPSLPVRTVRSGKGMKFKVKIPPGGVVALAVRRPRPHP